MCVRNKNLSRDYYDRITSINYIVKIYYCIVFLFISSDNDMIDNNMIDET